jgi:ribosomal protein S18 acetylase RimI-like enzyme
MTLVTAASADHIHLARELFIEYARSLEVDLCFQGFEKELAELPGSYAPPDGRLLLGLEGQLAAGCVAFRRIDVRTCEMKRLFVRPAFRRNGTGRLLTKAIIEAASHIGYARMRLDTLPSMKPAIALYKSLGFQPIKPYYENATPGLLFMELALSRPIPK